MAHCDGVFINLAVKNGCNCICECVDGGECCSLGRERMRGAILSLSGISWSCLNLYVSYMNMIYSPLDG